MHTMAEIEEPAAPPQGTRPEPGPIAEPDPQVTLTTIAHGAAPELFESELRRVLANIADPNTSPKAKRTITLKVVIMPIDDERDRLTAVVTCEAKVAPVKPAGSTLFLGRHRGRLVATELNPRQPSLFSDPKKPSPVEPLRGV